MKITEDEIIEITPLEQEELTYDIEVSDDNLFFANNILTHNCANGKEAAGLNSVSESSGIAMTADVIMEIYQNEEDQAANYFRVGFAKNRYGAVNYSVITKVNFETLRIKDLELDANYSSSMNTSIDDSLDELSLF